MPIGKQRKHEVSDYEQLRLNNIQDNKAVLEKLMADLKDVIPKPILPPSKTQRKVSRRSEELVIRRNPVRRTRSELSHGGPVRRSRRGSVSSVCSSTLGSEGSSPTKEGGGKLFVRFGFGRRDGSDNGSDSLDVWDEDDYMFEEYKQKRRRVSSRASYTEKKSAEDITEDDLELVATSVSDKSYCSEYGTTCHQCRQKTDDLKTICRNEQCQGVRGMFCGPCLRNRYGEDAKTALKNPSWICPPCRGICNCSFCRKKNGRCCTGILIHLAREHGFKDVNSYLQSFKS